MLALLADIHSNLEALDACLAHAREAGARDFALLGDLVGYGADPAGVIDRAMALAAAGAVVVKGNHDEAVGGSTADLNDSARAAIEWTRGHLDAPRKHFLDALPLCEHRNDVCFVHASADRPARWDYVDGRTAARRSIEASGAAYTFCGHVHDQRLYFALDDRMGEFRPTPGTRVPVPRVRRWLAIAGSVGQPRDGDPRAAYALLDDREGLTFHRVPYDHHAAADKIERSGLPASLAYRVRRGI